MSHPPALPAAVERHGRLSRAVMVVVGSVIAVLFGALGCALAVAIPGERGLGSAIGLGALVVFLLAIAAYGAWLAWRGVRGYSRPSPLVHRAMIAVYAFFMIAAAAGMVACLVSASRSDPVRLQRAPWWSLRAGEWRMAMLLLALPVQLLAHELGHVLAGRLVGFGFLSLQVGPFHLDRLSGRWRITLRPLELGLGGRAEVDYQDQRRLPQRSAIFAAGGPAANLAVALLAFLASAAIGVPVTAPGAVAAGLLGACAWSGLALTLLNLLPVGGAGTDGARILAALRARRPAREATEGARAAKQPPYLRVVNRD